TGLRCNTPRQRRKCSPDCTPRHPRYSPATNPGGHSMSLRQFAFVAAMGVAATTAHAQQKVLHVVPSADVAELDPTRAANQIGRIYSQMVFDTLFALDHTLSPKPMMVDKETVSDDGLTYTFTIRPGLKFSDGSAVTTRDIIASIEHFESGGSVAAQLKSR